jgi:hypothetical protein
MPIDPNIAEEAMTADQRTPVAPSAFGQIVTVDGYACVIDRSGKIPFDPQAHAEWRKRIALTITVQDFKGNTRKKEYLIDDRNDKGWKTVTLPSLQEHNVPLATLESRWVKYDLAPTGEVWEPADKPGKKVALTTFKFVEFFKNRDECEAASWEYWGVPESESENGIEHGSTDETPATSTPTPDSLALQAATAMWGAAGHDTTKYLKMIRGNPNVAKAFTTNGQFDEVAALNAVVEPHY